MPSIRTVKQSDRVFSHRETQDAWRRIDRRTAVDQPARHGPPPRLLPLGEEAQRAEQPAAMVAVERSEEVIEDARRHHVAVLERSPTGAAQPVLAPDELGLPTRRYSSVIFTATDLC